MWFIVVQAIVIWIHANVFLAGKFDGHSFIMEMRGKFFFSLNSGVIS